MHAYYEEKVRLLLLLGLPKVKSSKGKIEV